LFIVCADGRYKIVGIPEDVRGRKMYIEAYAEKIEASGYGKNSD
jgi:hypothetical protein